jgi:hypothetical protein
MDPPRISVDTRYSYSAQVPQKVPHHVHDVDEQVPVLDSHVDVGAEDQISASDILQILLQTQVPLEWGDPRIHPGRERMRARSDDPEPLRGRELDDGMPQPAHFAADRGG